jgi:hypothetical protein
LPPTYFGGRRDPGPFNPEDPRNEIWATQFATIKAFFTSTECWKLEPHDELLDSASPRGTDRQEHGQTPPPATTCWCLARPGVEYVIDVRGVKGPIKLPLAGDHPPRTIQQFDPRTGARIALAGRPGTGSFEYRPPDEQDWVVHLSWQPKKWSDSSPMMRKEIGLRACALDALPARCREVIYLRQIEGLPQKEIAARLGLSELTVQTHVVQGLRRMRAYFRQHGATRAHP